MNSSIRIVMIFFLITIIHATISPTNKSGGKEKKKLVQKKGPVIYDVFERNLVVKNPRAIDIIQESGTYHNSTHNKRFKNQMLGYITPWNNNGFVNALTFHSKFDMLSPVWFTLSFDNNFQLSDHDVQKKWLKNISSHGENRKIKILPRIIFENWSYDNITTFQIQKNLQDKLLSVLVKTAKTFDFNGYVLEVWNQFAFTGMGLNTRLSVVKSIVQKLRNHNLDVILTVPPLRGAEIELFTKQEFNALEEYVNGFSLMTYDYSSLQRPGPNSPITWIKSCVESLVSPNEYSKRAKILLGLNFYGYVYKPEGGGHIIGNDYLKLLESIKGKIQWDNESQEHFFELKADTGRGFVFYPTLYSIMQRLQLAEELGVGISVWELGQGLNYFYDLM